MKVNRFLVIIAHPKLGRIKRLQVPHWALHFGAGLAALALVTVIGLAAGYFKHAADNQRLTANNEALRDEYESLLLTVGERDKQVESLSNLAYQVSIAYGIRRSGPEAEDAFGSDRLPAYYASLNQFDRLQGAVHRSSRDSSELLANSTPSIWPVKGRITSSYGKRQDPFDGKGAFHPGMDISAPYGTPIRATADGYISFAGWDGGLGNCVRIRHGQSGFSTAYGHLHEYFVRPGQSVQRGEVIGLVGSTGRTTGTHVHYSVHYNGLTVNPYRYLRSKRSSYGVPQAD